ncbi:MAG TPA: AraC family transcriptional regulator [Stellaceae bacterium]|nr:AraC family transcriptional regulator [Stellaceae bacterium]
MTPARTQNALESVAAAAAIDARPSPKLERNFIEDELQWRSRPATAASGSAAQRAFATRWRSLERGTREVRADTPGDSHVVAIVLRNENVLFSVSGRTVHDGIVTPGTLHVTGPGEPTRCIFRGPCDVLHLYVPNRAIAEISRDLSDREPTPFRPQPTLTRDPMVERLARALLASERIGGSYARLYADSVSTAIVARLLGLNRAEAPEGPKVAELAKWRLKRAIEYIEASFADSVSLADIASAAGLTRMHFAAQFKAATGLRPHEYLLRRRIERAQEKLAGTRMSLVEVALSVGFQTQSHFTSVFTRMVGLPPRAWRQAQDNGAPCDFGTSRASPEAIRLSQAYPGRLAQPC